MENFAEAAIYSTTVIKTHALPPALSDVLNLICGSRRISALSAFELPFNAENAEIR
jgi:hypothetical protein